MLKDKNYVKYANFHIGSAATKYTLHVDGFTGNLGDALKNITSNHSLHLMLIMMVILKKSVDFYFAEIGGFVTILL